MSRKLLFAFSVAVCAALLSATLAQAAVVTLALPPTSTGLRMMMNGSGMPGLDSIGVATPGDKGGYQLTSTGTDALALSLAAGTGNAAKAFKFGWTGAALTSPGVKSGTVTLTGVAAGKVAAANVANPTMAVSGVVVANRVLNASTIGGSLGTPYRVMAKTGTISATLSTGNNALVDSDDYATRLNTAATKKASAAGVTATYAGAPLATFNAISQSADLKVSFGKPGAYNGELDLTKLVVNGEAKSVVGATIVAPSLTYQNVNALEQRKLKVANSKIKLGNVLKGAKISENYNVLSTNKVLATDSATHVTIATGGMAAGQLTLAQTTISDGSASSNVAMTGRLTDYNPKLAFATKEVTVVTAELASAGDTVKPYKSLGVGYTANVGIAKASTSKTGDFAKATVLTAKVGAGEKMASYDAGTPWSLASKVNSAKTLVENTTLASAATTVSLGKALYGLVGSEATIVDSNADTGSMDVSMQWRARVAGETFAPKTTFASTLPVKQNYLMSDVVQINGVNPGVAYALEMTYDTRIGLALEHGTREPGRMLQITTGGSKFQYMSEIYAGVNRGANAVADYVGTLAGFLDAKKTELGSAYDLDKLVGSCGYETTIASTTISHAWAIVEGNGSFAVVPEPSVLALMITGGLGLALAALRRRTRKSNV